MLRTFVTCLVLLALYGPSAARAQESRTLSGRLVNSLSGDPIPGAVVVVEELRREATAGADGSFTIDVPPGTYHVSVRAAGYSAGRTEIVAGTPIDLRVDPELHFEEVLSVSAEGRRQFEAFQPTSVLAGQELTKQLEMSLGATLENQPGVASRSFGPAPARPVIRGLEGDRVLILQDGQRLGDLSSQSGDHGVNVNPAAATRIEVVRGPATLLYGANAIGGLVNIITDEIASEPMEGVGGNFTVDLGSAARQASGAGDLHLGNGTLALHVGGGGRYAGDVRTPAGTVENSQSRNGFGNVGLSFTGEKHYFGGSYGYDDTRYGIPVIEDGQIELTPRRHAATLRGGGQMLGGFFDTYRGTLALRQYRHDEVDAGVVGTSFANDTAELELMGSHRALGRLKGSVGGWMMDRRFDARGDEALSPAIDQAGFAAFLYEEVTWPHVTFQFGARVDHTDYAPVDEPARDFTSTSGSVGLLVRPPAAGDRLTIAASLAHAARPPALEELFFFGVHHGNFALEVGNPHLDPERALGVDLSLRMRGPRGSAEVTYFRNSIDQFIFRREMTRGEFELREEEFVERFGGRLPAGHGHDGHASGEGEADQAFIEYVGADAVLQGIEAHADLQITEAIGAELGIDYVRGTLADGGNPLPRMPPLRGRAGLRYQYLAFQAGGEVVLAAAQDRLSGAETPTGGYQLLRLYSSYSFQTGAATSTITARVDNVTNELYRNHLSLIKDVVPEMGRNVKLLYNVSF